MEDEACLRGQLELAPPVLLVLGELTPACSPLGPAFLLPVTDVHPVQGWEQLLGLPFLCLVSFVVSMFSIANAPSII